MLLKVFRGPSRVFFFFFPDEKCTYTFLNALWYLPQLRIQNQKTKIPLYRITTLKKSPYSNFKDFNIYYIPIDSSNAKRTSFPFSRRSFILLPIHLKPGNVSWNAEEATLVKWLSRKYILEKSLLLNGLHNTLIVIFCYGVWSTEI